MVDNYTSSSHLSSKEFLPIIMAISKSFTLTGFRIQCSLRQERLACCGRADRWSPLSRSICRLIHNGSVGRNTSTSTISRFYGTLDLRNCVPPKVSFDCGVVVFICKNSVYLRFGKGFWGYVQVVAIQFRHYTDGGSV